MWDEASMNSFDEEKCSYSLSKKDQIQRLQLRHAANHVLRDDVNFANPF